MGADQLVAYNACDTMGCFFITFLLVSGLILPFDIRDMQSDTVTTFPQIIGIQNTKYLAYLLFFSSSLIAIFFYNPISLYAIFCL